MLARSDVRPGSLFVYHPADGSIQPQDGSFVLVVNASEGMCCYVWYRSRADGARCRTNVHSVLFNDFVNDDRLELISDLGTGGSKGDG